jgi:hypothetical protein
MFFPNAGLFFSPTELKTTEGLKTCEVILTLNNI